MLWPDRARSRYYDRAAAWPGVIYDLLCEQQEQFPGKPIVVIENGCTSADDVTRADYITQHLYQIQRAVDKGVPVEAYVVLEHYV